MRLIMVLLVLLLSGCQTKPKPFVLGDEVDPPFGCVEARKRGVEC